MVIRVAIANAENKSRYFRINVNIEDQEIFIGEN
jgi:hypothetical protein